MPPSFRHHAVFNGIIGRKTNAEQYQRDVNPVNSIQIAGCGLNVKEETMQLYYPSLDTQMPPNKILITAEISFLYYPILSKFFSGDFFCVLFLGEKKYMLSISKNGKKRRPGASFKYQ